jgi:hypothetical protein
MDHSTVQVTARYSHLSPDMFGPEHRAALKVSLAPASGTFGFGLGSSGPEEDSEVA